MKRALAAMLICAIVGCSKHGSSASSPVAAVANNPASASDGAVVYIANCSSCHQRDGLGVPGAFPPLSRSAIVNGDPARLIRIVKFGSHGKSVVRGTVYDGVMPGWNGSISDGDIAAVVTYIRASWSNQSGPVTQSEVRAASGQPVK